MKRPLILAAIAGLFTLATFSHAAEEVKVATGGYNAFNFSMPFESAVFPPGSEIEGKPIPLGQNKTLLVDIKEDAKEPIQMIVHLRDGRVEQFKLLPSADHSPANWHDERASIEEKAPIQRKEDGWFANVYRHLVAHPTVAPDGFRKVKLKPGRQTVTFSDLTANYLAVFADGAYKIYVMKLSSPRHSAIMPQDLFRPDVKSVLIDGDRVGPGISPLAIVVMAEES